MWRIDNFGRKRAIAVDHDGQQIYYHDLGVLPTTGRRGGLFEDRHTDMRNAVIQSITGSYALHVFPFRSGRFPPAGQVLNEVQLFAMPNGVLIYPAAAGQRNLLYETIYAASVDNNTRALQSN